MRQLLAGVIVLAVSLTAATAHAQADGAPPTTQPSLPIKWVTRTGIDNQIFPSEQISLATSRARIPFLRVALENVPAGTSIRIAVKCETLIDDSSVSFKTKKDNATMVVPVPVNWKFDRLARVRQQIPANFVYSLTINGQDFGEQTDTAIVHSINDCLLVYRDDAGKLHDARNLFAAYVNEDHPQIDKLLKDSLATGIVRQFDDYQEHNPKQVVVQVFAIWNALQLKGIKYSSIVDVPDKSDSVMAQHVRFLDESIDNAQANCVDGSVLFASVLQKIGIESALVLVPGHMFVVFYTEPGFKQPIALETTMLGNLDLPRASHSTLVNLLNPGWQSKASAKTFIAAVDSASDRYNKLIVALKQQSLDHSDAFLGRIIQISVARKLGIMPIPYEFTSNRN